jgi:hypothetical protein
VEDEVCRQCQQIMEVGCLDVSIKKEISRDWGTTLLLLVEPVSRFDVVGLLFLDRALTKLSSYDRPWGWRIRRSKGRL